MRAREMVEQYYRLRCQNTDRYLCVSEEGDLALCADKNRADRFAEELIEFTLPVAAWRQSGHSLNHGHAL